MNQEFFIQKYKELKSKLGRKPKLAEFYEYEDITKRKLIKAFGSDAYSKLQKLCGDIPNKLVLERTSLKSIYEVFAKAVLELGKLPTQSDWQYLGCKPTVTGLEKPPHNIKWTELPNMFLKYAIKESKYSDVIKIVERNIKPHKPMNSDKDFNKIINLIRDWRPQRKRFNEEGYKIELRSFLMKHSIEVDEEKGDSNIDLLVKNKIAVELKKDPSKSEYDRLFGQIARHLLLHKYLIVVICDINNEDRYKAFLDVVDFIYSKLNFKLEIVGK